MDPESATSTCARCNRDAVAQCDLCKEPICNRHLQHGRGAAHNVFGPMLFRSLSSVCDICYRERFWLAARGALALIAVVLVLVSCLERRWVLGGVMVSVTTLWWFTAGHFLALARSERTAGPGEKPSEQ